MLGYSTIFTMLPVFSLILDEDITRKIALLYPILYKSSQENGEINVSSFLYWMFISFYQVFILNI
jgi:phospholipid-translocating ATPase